MFSTTDDFTQTDPMPLGAGSPFESAYVYVGNNPVVYVDPGGLRRARGGEGLGNPIRAFNPVSGDAFGAEKKKKKTKWDSPVVVPRPGVVVVPPRPGGGIIVGPVVM